MDMPDTIWVCATSADAFGLPADESDTAYRRADLPPTRDQIEAMVRPLEWVTPSPTTDGNWQDTTGVYDIEESILFIGHVNTGIPFNSDSEAKAAANEHNATRILRALGLPTARPRNDR